MRPLALAPTLRAVRAAGARRSSSIIGQVWLGPSSLRRALIERSFLERSAVDARAVDARAVDARAVGSRVAVCSHAAGSPVAGSHIADLDDLSATSDFFDLDASALRNVLWTFRQGAHHTMRLLPGQFRLWKWRAGRMLQKWLPALSLVFLTGACGLVSHEGGLGEFGDTGRTGGKATAVLPALSKTRAVAPTKRAGAPWTYVLPIDHGVRVDESGKGSFRAPRFHGEHNGIDLLAPVGTPVFAACDGQVMAGQSRSFGHWLHVICPVPEAYRKSGTANPWASFFYAHLDEAVIEPLIWQDVTRGQKLGTVGKTGNADGASVQPHLHLELIVQQNQRTAMDEHHLGSDQSSAPAAEYFAETLEKECLDPFGFRPKSQMLRRARRLDPFVALSCLSDHKPDFRRAPAPLDFASHAWDRYYVAEAFNVNRGPEDHVSRR